MRLIAFVLAALVLSGLAAAEWKELNCVTEGFGAILQADPDVEEGRCLRVVPGKMVPARIHSARYDNRLFKMTVVDGRDPGLQEALLCDVRRASTESPPGPGGFAGVVGIWLAEWPSIAELRVVAPSLDVECEGVR